MEIERDEGQEAFVERIENRFQRSWRRRRFERIAAGA